MYRSSNIRDLIVLGLSGPIVALNLWVLSQVFRYFEQVITLLTVAAILAFLMNYLVVFFERARITRLQAIILVLLLALTVLIILAVTLVPVVTQQMVQLLDTIPRWLQTSEQHLRSLDEWAKARQLPIDLKDTGGRLTNQLENQVQDLAPQAVGIALGTLSGVFNTILVAVLAFYMLLYGDRFWFGLIQLLPPQIGIPLSESLRLNFQNFFISQLLLALFMFGILMPAFLLLKVPFALLFALLIGVSQLIPLIGATLGIGLVTILVMFQNVKLAFLVAGISLFVQQIKDNVLAPKLMGEFAGLNPLWILIALLLGVQIAGLLGAFLAVPIAGTIKGTMDAIRALNASDKIVPTEVIAKEP